MKAYAFWTFVVLLCFPVSLKAQDFPFSKYSDRREGIVDPKKRVSGEKIDLVAALKKGAPDEEIDDLLSYKLQLCLLDSAHTKILVQSFEYLYRMEPLRQSYPGGITVFEWPNTIPAHYGIRPENMYPLASWHENSSRKLAPIHVYQDTPLDSLHTYEFYFVTHKTSTRVEYAIFDSNTLEEAYAGSVEQLEENVLFPIRWNGLTTEGKNAPIGEYQLTIVAHFTSLGGRTVPIKYVASFYHCH